MRAGGAPDAASATIRQRPAHEKALIPMYNLHLTAEQLEFRDTLRDFVTREVTPAALHPDRLQPFEKPLLQDALTTASQMGLRTLALSEEAGGAGGDCLTACIVMEELGAGDPDLAMALARTSALGHMLFDRLMTPAQRSRFLPKFIEDDAYHLAFAGREPNAALGWSYHRPMADDGAEEATAVKQGNDWVINGSIALVANAPIAKLFAVQVRTDPKKTGSNGMTTLLVPRDTPGFTVQEQGKVFGATGADGEPATRWHHGPASGVTFKNCKVPADQVLGKEGTSPFANAAEVARSVPPLVAVNLGLGRAAYDLAVDYGKLRRQGGRPIIEHHAIGTILADCAIKLELARNLVWKAAWVSDHPEAIADRSVGELPLHVMARVYTAEAVHEITLGAAECFGAMGVMRDMPLQKFVHDGMVFLHAENADDAAKLEVAEAVSGYQRPLAA
jgi:alkylation response protein AidB-like acyl-CoA dehydrogenase